MTRHILQWMLCFLLFMVCVQPTKAEEISNENKNSDDRMAVYVRFADEVVPWYLLAAIDQYEKNIQSVRKDIPKKDGPIFIHFSNEFWSGALNPIERDHSPATITYFGGLGKDGDRDGVANIDDAEDGIYTMTSYLHQFGPKEDDVQLALWEYYKNEKTFNQILAIAKLYKHFQTIELDEHMFPIPKQFDYSYKGTWGASRGWGGRRIHEGTDLFAGHGTPVRSTSYGVIEVIGWNQFGGWRIGIRDNHNSYHYYAHLAHNNKQLNIGDIVKPGQIIGYVGSSGYGKEGTSGKFPPHLHYGIYKFDGRNEWAFDPYPSLLSWERQEKKKK